MEQNMPSAYYTARVESENGDEQDESLEFANGGCQPTGKLPPTAVRMTARSGNEESRPPSFKSARSSQLIDETSLLSLEHGDNNASDEEIEPQRDSDDYSQLGSDIVPPLDLKSICYSSPRDGDYAGGNFDFYYNNYYGGPPMSMPKVSPHLAFENWLSAKRRILSDKAAKRKREEAAKKREQEERKRLAAEKYQKWLESKQLQEKLKQTTKTKTAATATATKQRKPTNAGECAPQQPSKQLPNAPATSATSSATVEARQMKIKEWERNKRQQKEQQRQLKKLEKEKREREQAARQQLAEQAWHKWISEAPNKPKPVPLNRGLFTLRGTVSSIFINPNEWKSVDGS